MKIPQWLPAYGDMSYRGDCPPESAEQVTFFGWLRRQYPESYGRIAIHPRNEGKRSHRQAARHKSEGMTPGASDIIIPGCPSFVCELKRQDHTKCRFEPEQESYLLAAKEAGAFVCIAFGWEGARQAFNEWDKAKRAIEGIIDWAKKEGRC